MPEWRFWNAWDEQGAVTSRDPLSPVIYVPGRCSPCFTIHFESGKLSMYRVVVKALFSKIVFRLPIGFDFGNRQTADTTINPCSSRTVSPGEKP